MMIDTVEKMRDHLARIEEQFEDMESLIAYYNELRSHA